MTIPKVPAERVPSGSYSRDHDVAKGAPWLEMNHRSCPRPVHGVAARIGEVGAPGLVYEVLNLQALDDGQERGLEALDLLGQLDIRR